MCEGCSCVTRGMPLLVDKGTLVAGVIEGSEEARLYSRIVC